MAEVVYLLCAITSAGCAGLLLRNYRASRTKLLLWTGLCFVGLTLNSAVLFVDLVLAPQVDLVLLRNGLSIAAMVVLLFGLVWESP